MRTTFSDRVERGRVVDGPLVSRPGDDFGKFFVRTRLGVELCIIASSGSKDVPWEHVSVSTRAARCPSWEEMCFVKDLFWEEEEVVMQLHPRKSQYVNCHPFCLHLWRPLLTTIPTPPPMTVGPR
jgi:hypothetical protein